MSRVDFREVLSLWQLSLSQFPLKGQLLFLDVLNGGSVWGLGGTLPIDRSPCQAQLTIQACRYCFPTSFINIDDYIL